jgi:predicted DNA-binding transcriptional regulator AlpA
MTSIETIQKKIWLSEKEAEVYTGIGRQTLRKHRRDGLPYRRLSKKMVLYKKKEIDEYFDKHKPGS